MEWGIFCIYYKTLMVLYRYIYSRLKSTLLFWNKRTPDIRDMHVCK